MEFDDDELVAEMADPIDAEVLPLGTPLAALTKFIPRESLHQDLQRLASNAWTCSVTNAEELAIADGLANQLRHSLAMIKQHFSETRAIAYALHKRLTTLCAAWCKPGEAALDKLNARIYAEQARQQALAAEVHRRAQDAANQVAREEALREAELASQQGVSPVMVDALKRRAATATAAIVPSPPSSPLLTATPTTTWKARLIDTANSPNPNPSVKDLFGEERLQVFTLLKAILNGSAPLAAIELNWSYLNARARSDKSTFAIPGLEAFEVGSMRAKPGRRV